MMRLENRYGRKRNRTPVVIISSAIVVALAVVDWWTKPYVSLGFLYLLPIILSAGFLPRAAGEPAESIDSEWLRESRESAKLKLAFVLTVA
jgi:hypothetical protein